ncbi:hypothetical protein Lal_00033879 [Lupinus albus]|nr:hypothetical protein Lal_00033879 [Lupinus albus]
MPTITSYFGFLLAALTINSALFIGLRWILPPPFLFKQIQMIEVFLFGIVLGLITITLAGLFVTAYLQYRRGDQLWFKYFAVSFCLDLTRMESRFVRFEPTTSGFGDPRSTELN